MPLVADYSSSSSSCSSDSDTEDDGNNDGGKSGSLGSNNDNRPKLPSATQLLTVNTRNTGDVFKNPFREAESAKIAILEKHVKMVNKTEHIVEKNGRKICWNYRKGRCRFGSKCSFAHDSDLSTDPPRIVAEKEHPPPETLYNENVSSNQRYGQQKSAPILDLQTSKSNEPSGSSKNTQNTKRKRPGLSDSVTPSKKVIKSYMHGKQQKTTLT